jgi:hypothetical protein
LSHEKIYISFSDSYRESIFEIIKYLQNNNLDKKDIIFVREDNLFMWKLDRYSYHYENLSNTLENWTNPLFYYGFEKIGFDFQLSISNYIKYYDCMNVFTDVYDRVGSLLLGKKWINSDQFYKKTDIISDETIKNSLYSLLVDLKINEIFNE